MQNHAIRAVDHVYMANVDYGFWFTYALVMLARYTHVPHVSGILTAYVFICYPLGRTSRSIHSIRSHAVGRTWHT